MYRSLIPIFAEEASSRRSQRWQSASERDSSPWRLQTKTGGWPTRHPPYSTTWVESLTSEVREETRSASERSCLLPQRSATIRETGAARSRASEEDDRPAAKAGVRHAHAFCCRSSLHPDKTPPWRVSPGNLGRTPRHAVQSPPARPQAGGARGRRCLRKRQAR